MLVKIPKGLMLSLIGLLYSSANVLAQNTTEPLTLSQCINLAIENSYQMEADSLLSSALQEVVNQEKTSYYPAISGGVGLNGLFLSPYTFGQHYLQAVADWDLGKLTQNTVDAKLKQVEQQQEIRRATRLETAGIIAGLYLDMQQIQLDLAVLDSQTVFLEQHIKVLNALWKAGTIQQLDILQVQSTINTIEEARLQKQIDLKNARYALARFIGMANDATLEIEPISVLLSPDTLFHRVPAEWLANHPESRVMQKQMEAEILRKSNVKAGYLPHIQSYAGYTFDGDPTADGSYFMLGIGASIPIFSWHDKDYQLAEIDTRAQAIQSGKKEVERNLSIRYEQAVRQVNQYYSLLAFEDEKIQTDQKAARLAEFNYKAGLASNLDFLAAQQTLIKARLSKSEIQNKYIKSVVAFFLITGQIDELKNL